MSTKRHKIEPVGNPSFSGWPAGAGEWKVTDTIELTEVDRREIYRSPEEPSHVAWAGIWKELDGSINVRFPQITGNPGLDPSYAPWYGRSDFKKSSVSNWHELARRDKVPEGPPDAIDSTKLHYITMVTHDNGDTWKKVGQVPGTSIESSEESRGYNTKLVLLKDGTLVGGGQSIVLCRDGRLVRTAPWYEYGYEYAKKKRKPLVGVQESLDNGKSWSPIQWILPEGTDKEMIERGGHENDMVELADGRILVVIRADKNIQTYLRRTGPGQYIASTPTWWTKMEHCGQPDLVRCSDGTIWYWGISGHSYTIDDGETWHPLPEEHRFTSYYGKMIEARPNQIMCVTQQLIGDCPYPHQHDAFIEQIRFSYRRNSVIKQRASTAGLAMIRMPKEDLADLHLRVDVLPDKLDGVAFRVSPDGKSYYVFAVATPDTEQYKRWYPPVGQEETLSAYFPGLGDESVSWYDKKKILAIAVLAKVNDGQVKAIRGIVIDNIWNARLNTRPGDWLQLQVKAQGDLIQAAVSNGRNSPAYIGIRDATCRQGGVGLLTDGSLGEFKNLAVWPQPQMIRDLWTIRAKGE